MVKLGYDGPGIEIDKLYISFFTRLREIHSGGQEHQWRANPRTRHAKYR